MASTDITITATGEEILKAVRVVAGEFIVEIKQTSAFVLGQKRGTGHHSQLIVLADGKPEIDPNKIYQQITIKEFAWGGLVWEITLKQIETEICDFAKKLRKELENQQRQEEKV